MVPILRKLSAPGLAPSDIADILERHVGAGADERLCGEACEALRRLRMDATNFYVRVAMKALDPAGDPRTQIRKVITALRSRRHISGA
jgi:hypothetical protein